MKWSPYYDGHFISQGLDLYDILNDYDHERSFNFIDNLIVQDSVYDEEHQGAVLKKRAALNKEYGIIDTTAFNVNDSPEGEEGESQVIPTDENHRGIGIKPKGE